jgi:hypothetical protein
MKQDGYSWTDYEVMFSCCCVGAGNTADISVPKTVENIVHLVNQFRGNEYTRQQVVRTLDSLVEREMLMRVCDRYKRPPYVCSREIRGLIPGQPDKLVMAIVRLHGDQDIDLPDFQKCTLLWEFMILPSLCAEYNEQVNEVLNTDFEEDLKQAAGSLDALKKLVKAYKKIDVSVQTAMGLVGSYGIGGVA